MSFKYIGKVIFSVALTLAVCVSFCACGSQQGNDQSESNEANAATADTAVSREKRKIIIDTDTGADDASAMILAATQDNVEILGVTVMVGNVDIEQSTKNALAVLEIAGCDAPVYKGSEHTIDGTVKKAFSVYGTDGMGDADLIHTSRQAESGDAIDFIIDTVRKNPNEVEIIALGPATNIAKAIQKAPEDMKKVKKIWSMGTAGLGEGNASPVAEFNVCADAQAYKIMLDSDLPLTVIGLDMCGGEAMWTDAQFEELESTNEIGEFIAVSFGKLREFYKKNGNENVMNCDSLAMMCALYPDFIKSSVNTHASCITEEGETNSQVIFYKEGFTYDIVENNFENYNTVLVTDVDKTSYFNNYLEAIK